MAIVSNGTRVLGLGNIGPAAALPVMEGKALFYSLFVGLNAVPIMLDTQDPDEIIETVVRIAPGFGAIHLEDIASPGVYRIETELDARLPVPVMHDDQRGTATVVLGAVLAAVRKLDRSLDEVVFGQVGLGAAGSAIAALASRFPFGRIVAFDPGEGAVAHMMERVEPTRRPDVHAGHADTDFEQVVAEADILVLATGRPGLLWPEQVRPGSVVFAISNPVPEITIEEAEAGWGGRCRRRCHRQQRSCLSRSLPGSSRCGRRQHHPGDETNRGRGTRRSGAARRPRARSPR